MVDSFQTEGLDDWFFVPNNSITSDVDQTSLPLSSSNDLSLPVTKTTDEDNQIKKRKLEQKTDVNETKKSKQTPAYMRRNIRQLITNDKLQFDTLSALKAEHDRLKRLEEINEQNQQYQTLYNHLFANNCLNQYKTNISPEQDCIILDDDEHERKNHSTFSMSSTERKNNNDEDANNDDDDDDDSDCDIQYLDSNETEIVDEKLAQKLQRLHVDDRVNIPDENGNILVNINHPTTDPDLYLSKHLCSILKPHQIGGIRFMYDNIVESLQQYQIAPGLGCILAHAMGCGKTLQVITFIDIFLRYTTGKSILIVVPINTIQNWVNEFNRWSPIDDPIIEYQRPYQLYILNETSKKSPQRTKIVQNWSQTGGVLLIGYEMFRLMVTKKNTTIKTNKSLNVSSPLTPLSGDNEDDEKNLDIFEEVRNILLNSDLVICDEGHRIKNHQASVAIALKSIKTKRRIVLTGYPLQNNLIEYWCMVDFVRPNYLGTKQEFCNMFARPILNGQCVDSTLEDRQLMRARAHVLHSLLEGFVQRRGHDVLQNDLPSKTECVILLKLSSIQRQLYMKFLETIGVLSNTMEKMVNPLKAFALCCKIWNHPDVLYKSVRDRQDGLDIDFDIEIDQNSTTNRSLMTKTGSTNRFINNNQASPISSTEKKEFDYDFANSILASYICGQLANGIKFQVALEIIDLSIQLGDKVLLFSQSLLSLNKFEEFLQQCQIPNTIDNWKKNIDYYRLDGGTNSLERERLINAFNAPNSNVKLFLLSTRAGCLGINLIAANRVIVMDVSWNPCLDAQAVCRVYRYGQFKHCFIYRLIADYTMEKRIYDRQIAKQGMSNRVVDELQPETQFTRNEVENLIHFAREEEPAASNLIETIDKISTDWILISICQQFSQSITKIPFTHESLLLDKKEYQLTSAEKRRAQKEYQYVKQMNIHSNRSKLQTARSSAYIYNTPRSLDPYMSQSHIEHRYYGNTHANSTLDRKLERLKQQGISVQTIVLQSPLEVQINALERESIPAGIRVHVIKSPRGSYIRTPDGKFFAIRQPPTINTPKPITPPPPPAPLPSPPPPTSTFFDDLFSDSPSFSSQSSSTTNDFNNEIDHLLSDINIDPSFDTFNNWSNDFSSYLFPNQSSETLT